jgi:hypothetical protein
MDNHSFTNLASFGKRIEHFLIGQMLKEGLDVYLPVVDDKGIDAVVRRPDGSFVEIQIKARSKAVKEGDAALFAAIEHEYRPNYWFVFYSERIGESCTMWIMSSKEFIEESIQNKNGKNVGKRSIWFNGKRKGVEYAKPRFEKYIRTNFQRIITEKAE